VKKINSIVVSIIVFLGLIGCGEVTTLDNSIVTTTGNSGNINSSENSQKIYDKCAGCHGVNGEKFALGKSKVIGGENKEALLYQLQEYKTGGLDQYGMGQLMKGQVVGLTDSELESVSEYVSKLSGI